MESATDNVASALKENQETPTKDHKTHAEDQKTHAQDQKTHVENQNPANYKRKEYLDWDDFFMATAFLVAKRSKDPVSQVGACIVNSEKKIVATGYNGLPIGCSDDEFPWGKNSNDPLELKYLYVCHAEMNAIMNKNSADVRDCTMYVGLFPCNECAKIIIQSGIRKVFYMSDKYAHKITTIAAKRMFDSAGVEYKFAWKTGLRIYYIDTYPLITHLKTVRFKSLMIFKHHTCIRPQGQYVPNNAKIVIDFNEINWNEQQQVQLTPQEYREPSQD